MKEEVQLTKYKKEGFFEKIKNKIINMFFKKENTINNYKLKEETIQISKDDFFKTYKRVKNNEISIDTLDEQTLKKILRMVIEEMNINDKKITEKLEKYKISLDNTKMYNKEIEIYIKQNS